MAATIDQLAADFSAFQTTFAAFVANVQTALNNIAAGGITAAQQTELNNIDAALTTMGSQIAAITFPGATPPATPPAAKK